MRGKVGEVLLGLFAISPAVHQVPPLEGLNRSRGQTRHVPNPAPPAPPQAPRAIPSGPLPLRPELWVTTDDYPPDAYVRRAEGTTHVQLYVSAAGRVTRCLVMASSGHPDLDAAACRTMQRRARFAPALDRSGSAVVGTFVRRVVWRHYPEMPPRSLDRNQP